MNVSFKGNVVKVKRGTFTNDKGEVVAYCRFYLLTIGKTDENEAGYDYRKFSCKVDYYKTLIGMLESNKPVDLSVELVEQKDGTYKCRATKINDIVLN